MKRRTMIQTSLPFVRSKRKREDPPSTGGSDAVDTGNKAQAPATVAAAEVSGTRRVTPPKTVGPSPYHTREALMEEYRASVGEDYTLLRYRDILEQIPYKLDEFDVDEEYRKLTTEEVDEYYNVLLVRHQLVRQCDDFKNEIKCADPNGPSNRTSELMISVVEKQLSSAHSLIKKVTKEVDNKGIYSVYPGVAKDAMDATLAALFACEAESHWRDDENYSLHCDTITEKISLMLKGILEFHDEELGFVDPFSRKSLLNRLKQIGYYWDENNMFLEEPISFLCEKNRNGEGRSLRVPRSKDLKPKTVTTWGGHGGQDANNIVEYLNALGDRLSNRTKTIVQLAITEAFGSRSCKVVCSGSTSLKKLNQLVAYLTGHADDYDYHINRGKSIKGSYLELSIGDTSKLWLGDKTAEKKARAQGIGPALDKPIKLVQVFQGLILRENSGMVFDSEKCKKVSLVWVSDKGDRYSVKVEGILPSTGNGRLHPMPRVVDDRYEKSNVKTGFGMCIYEINEVLRGDRQAPERHVYYLPGEKKLPTADKEAAKPMCRANGIVEDARPDLFKEENIELVWG